MGVKVPEEAIAVVRSVVGSEFSEMDVIRALHMAANDAAAAINIIFDTPHLRPTSSSRRKSLPVATSARTPDRRTIPMAAVSDPGPDIVTENCRGTVVESVSTQPVAFADTSSRGNGATGSSWSSSPAECDWWFVGSSEITGLSTCKGRRIRPGDKVTFSYPSEDKLTSLSTISRFPGRGRSMAQCSEIMRFSSDEHGELGRIPNEWARCLLPLVKTRKIKIEGSCKSAPDVLGIMDAVLLSVSVYINSSMFRKRHLPSVKSIHFASEDSTIHPLPTLFTLLGQTPFKKAEFTPEDLYVRKRHVDAKEDPGSPVTISPSEKWRKLSSGGSKVKNDDETISDADIDSVIGTSKSCELEEMNQPDTLRCDLRPYQKQAVHWMVQLEQGAYFKEAATTLHPCWNAYRLKDKRDVVLYVNAFSGDATTEFPSTLQMARGGILADAMGLGKTIMTIALVLAHNSKGDSSSFNEIGYPSEANEISELSDQSPHVSKKVPTISGFTKLFKSKASLIGGGTLIVCPMTLLGQWKVELETHVKPGSLSIYVHYGQSRSRDAKFLVQSDVVLTTYGVLVSEFSDDVNAFEENTVLYSVQWFRVVLDEAHTIKSSKSQVSKAAAALNAGRRWCLTGTPIQNNLEDVYSLLRFLRVEPWANWGLWHKLIQKPYEEGDERGLKLVQSILKSIMLRRTKYSTDREGRPILVLPPAQVEVLYCDLSAAEKDFYEALFKRSKVRFDQFVEQGRILHNYASILELLLRLRQCCDHPFLVMSRGDTQEFSDLDKLAKRFLQGGKDASGSDSDVPSSAYIKEVVEELRKGEGECPICLEAFEDAVLTPCAHRLCRECLLTSWQGATTGLCPVCRKYVDKKNLITAPTDSRFQIDVKKNWVESSKVSVLLQELGKIRPSGAKSIVFSQWTAFLDLLEIPLSRQNISFLRLDGTLSQQQRESVLNNFSEDKNILVLLMSLKAGGVGLNLTAASNAFLMDPWWNPAVEEQALMRIHRIGQNKSVSIKRFIVKGTVEERMKAVQARKNRMITGALTDQEVRNARMEELKMLFT